MGAGSCPLQNGVSRHAERRQSLCSVLLTTRGVYVPPRESDLITHLSHGYSARLQTHTAGAGQTIRRRSDLRLQIEDRQVRTATSWRRANGRVVGSSRRKDWLHRRISTKPGQELHDSILACVARWRAFPTTIQRSALVIKGPTLMPTGARRCPFDQRESEHLAQTAVGYLRTQRHAGRRYVQLGENQVGAA
jgi:hypothetical protein